MKKGRSKGKGNAFERKISGELSLWLTEGKEERCCWRSDTSGGTATILAKKGKEARYVAANSGDIRQVVDKGVYPKVDLFFSTFVVECKHYKSIDFYPPFTQPLTAFFEACLRQKEATGKKAVLIVKANNRKILYLQEEDPAFPLDGCMTITYKGMTLALTTFDEITASRD